MTAVTFTANEVSYQQEGDYHILAFYNDDHYLFLQRHIEIGHKEDDGVYLEYNNELHCGFDVIDKAVFTETLFTIELKSHLHQLPGVEQFLIELSLSNEEVGRYRESLKNIFKDKLVKLDV